MRAEASERAIFDLMKINSSLYIFSFALFFVVIRFVRNPNDRSRKLSTRERRLFRCFPGISLCVCVCVPNSERWCKLFVTFPLRDAWHEHITATDTLRWFDSKFFIEI